MLFPVQPDRLRVLEKPFAPVPCRLLTQGYLRHMTPPAKLLYLLLSLAADRRGLSCFGARRICVELGISPADLDAARNELVQHDFIAWDGHTYQVLPLPAQSAVTQAAAPSAERPSPSRPPPPNSPSSPSPSYRHTSSSMPEHVRQSLRRIFPRD